MRYARYVATVSGIAALILLAVMAGRQNRSVSANEQPSLFARLASPIHPATVVLPAGTKIHVRLEDTLSTEINTSGDHFSALLDEPLVAGKTEVPVGSRIIGEVAAVSKPSSGARASLTLILQKLLLVKKEYDLHTAPLVLIARNTIKRELPVSPGESLQENRNESEHKPSTGNYVLATQGAPLAFGPESRFAFTLSEPAEFPIEK